jgi:hypothetical protein
MFSYYVSNVDVVTSKIDKLNVVRQETSVNYENNFLSEDSLLKIVF